MKVELAKQLKTKPLTKDLVFGKFFTDHMFEMNYKDGKWDEGKIVPYAPMMLDPATTAIHYGQGIFEGMKAYKNSDGKITTFRAKDNFARMNRSCEIMCMPKFDEEKALFALQELLKIEKDWIPTDPGTALYIRPFLFGTDPALGVHASHTYKFVIILCPVGAYYKNGLMPTKIRVEEFFVRACIGGTGEAKCMGNYGASLRAGEFAARDGYDQVLWLDGKDKKYIEEVGSMNIFFVIDGEVITPALTGSILHGVTRKSSVELLTKYGYKVSERKISIDEVETAAKSGKLTECFGTGTAAVVSPVGLLNYKGKNYEINGQKMGEVTAFLYDRLTGIQTGKYPDEFGWIQEVG